MDDAFAAWGAQQPAGLSASRKFKLYVHDAYTRLMQWSSEDKKTVEHRILAFQVMQKRPGEPMTKLNKCLRICCDGRMGVKWET